MEKLRQYCDPMLTLALEAESHSIINLGWPRTACSPDDHKHVAILLPLPQLPECCQTSQVPPMISYG